MLIDIGLRGKTVVIFGGGTVGERKAAKFLAAGANVAVASKDFTERLRRLDLDGKLQLIPIYLDRGQEKEQIGNLASKADFVVAATNQPELNRRIADEAKKRRIHVNVVDNPQLGDFTMPDTSKIGEFRIAISTGGKSPAMSSFLRRRIEGLIRDEDIQMVRLQFYARKFAKARIPNQQSRKRALGCIMEDKRIRRLLRKGDFQEAKGLTRRIIRSY